MPFVNLSRKCRLIASCFGYIPAVFACCCLALSVTAAPRLQRGHEPVIHVLIKQTSSVVTLPLEEYLRGVVPSEIGASAPPEAKAAQAVAARAFAAVALGSRKHAAEGCDVCDTVHCQVYSALDKATTATDAAVSATRGLILMYAGKPMPAYYASNCGGHTEDIGNSWPERANQAAYRGIAHLDGAGKSDLDLTKDADFRKWLASSPDAYCNPQKSEVVGWAGKNFRWTRELTADEATSLVATKKDIGRVLQIRAGTRGESGRLSEVEFVGEKGKLRVSPQLSIRDLFDPMLKSSAFSVETSGPATRPTHFILRGAGSGHGVGMCQTGAMGMANAGKSFREILKHYYPKAILEKFY